MVDCFVPVQGIQGLLRGEYDTRLLRPAIGGCADKEG